MVIQSDAWNAPAVPNNGGPMVFPNVWLRLALSRWELAMEPHVGCHHVAC